MAVDHVDVLTNEQRTDLKNKLSNLKQICAFQHSLFMLISTPGALCIEL